MQNSLLAVQRLQHESAHVYKGGALVAVFHGDYEQVELDPDILKGSIVIHNHPYEEGCNEECGLSQEDFDIVRKFKAKRIVAICSKGHVHSYKKGGGK